MTAGDLAPPTQRRHLSGDRLRRGREGNSAMNRRGVILFLVLTVVWLAVIWTAVFGSRPHLYLVILFGTYIVGVLSGTGISTVFRRGQSRKPAASPESDAPVDAEVRPVS